MRYKIAILFAIIAALTACGSSEKKEESVEGPAWIHSATRVVDNGYIVYVGHGEGPNSERAEFKAEGVALEDLANECSLVPRGARIEDRFSNKLSSGAEAWVKIAVEFQLCDEAMKSMDPQQIKKLANTSFIEQLRRYQELEETGALPDKEDMAEVQPPSEVAPAPTSNGDPRIHFFMSRQYVAYQKEIVILSPTTAYAPGSPETQHFVTTLQPVATQIQTASAATPALRSGAWSTLQDHPRLERPLSLRPISVQKGLRDPHAISAPHQPAEHQGRPGRMGHGGHRRGRGFRCPPGNPSCH